MTCSCFQHFEFSAAMFSCRPCISHYQSTLVELAQNSPSVSCPRCNLLSQLQLLSPEPSRCSDWLSACHEQSRQAIISREPVCQAIQMLSCMHWPGHECIMHTAYSLPKLEVLPCPLVYLLCHAAPILQDLHTGQICWPTPALGCLKK